MLTRAVHLRGPGRFGPGLAIVVSWITLATAVPASEPPSAFLKGPYLQWPGADTMTVMWESAGSSPGILRFGLRGKLDQELRLEAPRLHTPVSRGSVTNVNDQGRTNVSRVSVTNRVFLYELTLTNLRPDSVYTYVAETAGARTKPKRFRTLAANPRKVRFIAYGDTRTNPKIHEAVGARFKAHAPDFILHTGDLVAAGKRYELWEREFFGPLANVIDELPFVPVIGNHEEDGSNYLHYVHLPGSELWYGFDAGPVHVLGLDYRYDKGTHPQFEFARQDLLKSRAPWKIVTIHHPVFNIGAHGSGWGHAAYLPLFQEAKVDLVIVGHSHIYERFRPIAPTGRGPAWPVAHVTTGGGGAPLATSFPHPALVTRAITNHYLYVEATATTLKARAYTTNGAVIDTFELKKSNGRPPREYLAQVYPEEAMVLAFQASTNLAARLADRPKEDEPAQAMFTIGALGSATYPVELEITLAPDSAPYYRMPDGPLRVTAPGQGEKAKVVWAKIAATGKRSISTRGSSRELNPTLQFLAKLRTPTLETLSYGKRSRVSSTATEAAKKLADEDDDPDEPK